MTERLARPRTRASAKKAGSWFETSVAAHLARHIDDRIERRVRYGAKDRGDVSGVRLSPALRGGRVALELKNTARMDVGPWLREAERERGNDDALVAAVISKRHGIAAPGSQLVIMTVDDLIALITGSRPEESL
jgi:hypothetical protein